MNMIKIIAYVLIYILKIINQISNNFKTDGYSVRFVKPENPINNSNILLNGTVSAENNQIKNVANPTDAQDAVTKDYLEE